VLAPEWQPWRGSGGGNGGSSIRVQEAVASAPGGDEMQELVLVSSAQFFKLLFSFFWPWLIVVFVFLVFHLQRLVDCFYFFFCATMVNYSATAFFTRRHCNRRQQHPYHQYHSKQVHWLLVSFFTQPWLIVIFVFWFLLSSLCKKISPLPQTWQVHCWFCVGFVFCHDGLDGGHLTDLLLFHYSFCFLHQVDYYDFSLVCTPWWWLQRWHPEPRRQCRWHLLGLWVLWGAGATTLDISPMP